MHAKTQAGWRGGWREQPVVDDRHLCQKKRDRESKRLKVGTMLFEERNLQNEASGWTEKANYCSLEHRRKSTSRTCFSTHDNKIRMNCAKSKKCVFPFLLSALRGQQQQQNWNLLFLSVSLDLRMKHDLHNMWHVRPTLVSGFQRPNITFKHGCDAPLF